MTTKKDRAECICLGSIPGSHKAHCRYGKCLKGINHFGACEFEQQPLPPNNFKEKWRDKLMQLIWSDPLTSEAEQFLSGFQAALIEEIMGRMPWGREDREAEKNPDHNCHTCGFNQAIAEVKEVLQEFKKEL